MAKHISELLDRAAKDNLSTLDVIHRLCDEEKQSRLRSAVDRRLRDARFPEINTIDGFNFDFDPVRKRLRARYLALHDLAFLAKGINPLFIGVPGTGKTFLARALAYQACQAARRVVFVTAPRMLNDLHGAELHGGLERALRRYVRAELLVIDDFAVLAMDPAQAKLAFQVISERYDFRRSTCITSNQTQYKSSHKGFNPQRAAGRCRRGAAGAGTLAASAVERRVVRATRSRSYGAPCPSRGPPRSICGRR